MVTKKKKASSLSGKTLNPKPETPNSQTPNQQPETQNIPVDQVLEAWRINNRINLLLIEAISDDGLNSTLSTRGGRTVALQFAHAHNVRLGWLEHLAKDIYNEHQSYLLDKEEPADKRMLMNAFIKSGNAIEQLIQKSGAEGGKLKSYKRGLIPFISYLMTHEAHHRGHAILTLKETGNKIDEKVKWGIWEWEKI